MTSPVHPNDLAQARPFDLETARRIVAMIDEQRERLSAQWASLERGSRESAENLAADDALMDLRWNILAVGAGHEPVT